MTRQEFQFLRRNTRYPFPLLAFESFGSLERSQWKAGKGTMPRQSLEHENESFLRSMEMDPHVAKESVDSLTTNVDVVARFHQEAPDGYGSIPSKQCYFIRIQLARETT